MDTSHAAFFLFANCIPVKGARRSLVCDLQYGRFDFIPNGLYHILTELRGRAVSEVKAAFPESQHAIIDEYFEFLKQKEYGFFCAEPDLFPQMDLTWMAPEQVTNAIIDVNEHSSHPFAAIFAQLDGLGCKAVQLRFFDAVPLEKLRQILGLTRRGGLRHIDLLLRYTPELSVEILSGVCMEHLRVSAIVIHAAPLSTTLKLEGTGVPISFKTTSCDSPSCCGQTSPKHFVVNIDHFTEAKNWNTCLNRKISIAADGSIKNCPSMTESFGNVNATSLSAALEAPRFKELWDIKKDGIKICRDCEFRYICTDCRAYREDISDLASKPLKCGYDPYTAEWKDSDGNPDSTLSQESTAVTRSA